MKLTYYGHSCFAVEIASQHLLFDPFITPNEKAAHIALNSIHPNFILLSHGHADHVADAIALASATGAKVISNFEICEWLGKQGISNLHAMNHGGSYTFKFGTVKMTNAIHSSSLPDGSYGGNPAGFVIQFDQGVFYYAGDTALTLDMQLVGEEFALDFAVLPIGDNFTMGASDAVKAAAFVKTDKVVGVHYDTFPPIRIDHTAAQSLFTQANKQLFLPKIGETITL